MQPIRSKSVHRIDGHLCYGPVETLERWREHFQSVLNVSGVYNDSTINLMPVLPLRSSMESPLTLEEIWEALSSVNSWKAAGKNGLLPELLKCCDVYLMEYMICLLLYRRRKGCQRSGVVLCWYLCQRKGTLQGAITGEGLAYW